MLAYAADSSACTARCLWLDYPVLYCDYWSVLCRKLTGAPVIAQHFVAKVAAACHSKSVDALGPLRVATVEEVDAGRWLGVH